MAILVVVLVLAYMALVALVIRGQRRRLRARRQGTIDLTESEVPTRLDDARAGKRQARHFRGGNEV
jgi:hypothetical protein